MPQKQAVTAEEFHQMVEVAAYFFWLQGGVLGLGGYRAPNDALNNWLVAEQEISFSYYVG